MLLKRNTRKVSPTALGLDLLQECADIARARDSIARKIARSATSMSGTLHVAMPIEFGTAWLGQAISNSPWSTTTCRSSSTPPRVPST